MGSISVGQFSADFSALPRSAEALFTRAAERPHPGQAVPHLRQYARLVLGRRSGDMPLARIVGQAVGAAAEMGPTQRPRLAVFRAFHTLLASGALQSAAGIVRPAYSEDRLAMLLADLMGFHETDIATILALPLARLRDRIEAGRAEIADLPPVPTLIAEDETWIAADLEVVAADLGLKVSGVASTHADILELARRTEPGLVIADACLDGSVDGLKSALDLREVVRCPIVYVTGLADRLSELAHLDDAIVLAKPCRASTLRAAIGHVLTP